jgi:RecB family exonuclease
MMMMGKLLDRAIEEAHKLSEEEQEAVGAWLLAEIESERKWDELFSCPPSEALERMAAQALEDHRAGRTTPLDPEQL